METSSIPTIPSSGDSSTEKSHSTKQTSILFVVSFVLFLLSMFFIRQFSLVIISSINAVQHNISFNIGHKAYDISSRSLLSSEQNCAMGYLSAMIEVKTANLDTTESAEHLRQRISASNVFSIDFKSRSSNFDHSFTGSIPIINKSKQQFCLQKNNEYIAIPQKLRPVESTVSAPEFRYKFCNEVISSTAEKLIVRVSSERCFVKIAPKEAALITKSVSVNNVDCTEDPTSAPTSMPTRFIPANSTGSGSSQQIYETTTFISTVSAVGGTALVATAGGVAYAAARSAKYFVQVPFAPEDLAMQI